MTGALDLSLSPQDWIALRPVEILTVVAVGAMLLSAFLREERGAWVGWFSLAGLGVALADLLRQWGHATEGFQRMLVTDGFTVFFGSVFLAAAMYTVLLSIPYLGRSGLQHGEYYALIVFAALGAVLMAGSGDLVMTFIGLETLSLASARYHRFMAEQFRSRWPAALPTNEVVGPVKMLALVSAFAAHGEVVYAHPSSGLFLEWFVSRPNGLIHRLVPRGPTDTTRQTLEPGVVATNEHIWQQRWTGTLGKLLRARRFRCLGDYFQHSS